ncbi:uncharacterized protein [Watersipora subatra]|uniref:uncharacterized protein n=1 Tax=Watersipora subatra TaxID=2589382 RepID=UPI00355C51CB
MSAAPEEKKSVRYHWTIGHYFNFPQQLASKLYEHQSNMNFLCHLFGGPSTGIAGTALLQALFGNNVALGWIVFLSLIAIVNDPINGVLYAAFSIYTTLWQLEALASMGILRSLALMTVGLAVQIGLGHGYFEGVMPNSPNKGIVKFDTPRLNTFYFLNAAIFGTFHFYTILCLRLGLRPGLNSMVEEEYEQILYTVKQGPK